MIDSLGIYRSLIALVPKPGSRLAPYVVRRIENVLRDPEAIINITYI
jgi:hypothetical protein